jgi:choline/glycine/proline betaine transport protein
MQSGVDFLFAGMTINFGWFYMLSVAFFIFIALFFALGPYGKIRLGDDDEKPEFGNFQWFAMLFGGGMGIGLIFWSVAEPMTHYMSPPFGEGGTPDALNLAIRTTFFNWGIHPWVTFAIGGLGLAYAQFRKKMPFLISSAFYPLLGDKIHGPIGKAIDILAVFATIFGVATSLGFGANQIAAGVEYIWGVKSSPGMIVFIIAIMTIVSTLTTVSGLHKAMQGVANLKIWISVAFMVFIFLFGGMVFILNHFTWAFGDYIQNFIGQTFWMGNMGWLSGWTIFYWAWWIAWTPFVGQFVARVSRGRTIREFILGVSLLPAAFSLIWIAIYGGAAFNLDAKSGGALQTAIKDDYTTALFVLLNQLPAYAITSILSIVLILTCFVGASNSATYVLSMLSSGGDMDPKKKLRAGWGAAQGAVAIALILVSGTSALRSLQTASIVAAFPFAMVMIFMCISLCKALSEDSKKLSNKLSGGHYDSKI